MSENQQPTGAGANQDLSQIIESAHRLGVELDEADALQWLTAMAAQPRRPAACASAATPPKSPIPMSRGERSE